MVKYNYKDLINSENINTNQFKSNSDGEIILFLYQKYGKKFVEKLNGMFAIAIIDLNKEKFYLFRDTLGQNQYIIIMIKIHSASELRSLKEMEWKSNFSNENQYKTIFAWLYTCSFDMYQNI